MKRGMPMLLLATACAPAPVVVLESSSGEPNPSGSSTTDDPSSGTTGSRPAGSSSTTNLEETVGDSFLIPPDGGGMDAECSAFHQDCPPGHKCNAWADDGGNAWNATKCVPLDPDPAEVDEPCTVAGSGVSGLDTCALGAMCWDVDSETEQGYCVPFCTGSESAPLCSDPNRACNVTGDGILTLCFLNCDPLEAVPCGPGEACYPIDNGFVCAPDHSGADGTVWDACDFINACDPGLLCVNPELSAMCPPDSGGCCLPAWNTSAPDCPAGMVCEGWFQPGLIEPGYEDVGVCWDGRPRD